MTVSSLVRAAYAVAGVLADASIHANVDARRGPRLACFDLTIDAVAEVDRVMRMGRALAAALQVRRVRLSETARGVAVECELPRAMWQPLTASSHVGIGLDARGRPVNHIFALPESAHLLIVGATGSGKTTALQSIVWQMAMKSPAPSISFVMIDGLASGLAPFAALPHLALPLATTPAEGAYAIASICRELDARIADPTRRTPLFVVVDELAQLTNASDAVGAGLARIAATGRGLRTHLICATQHPTASVVGRLVSANITTRLVGKVADAAASRLAMGSDRDDARTLLGAGDMLLCRGDDVRRVQCPVVTDAEWAMLPAGARVNGLDVTLQGGIPVPHPAGYPDSGDVARVVAMWDGGGMPGIMRIRAALGCGDSRARRLREAAARAVGDPGIPTPAGEAPTRAGARATMGG